MKTIIVSLLTLFSITGISAQQLADTSYNPSIPVPEYPEGAGPVVFIDEGHNNFHTINGNYLPFARLLRSDGYRPKGYHGKFREKELEKGSIMVIANALNNYNVRRWYLPTLSAFTPGEIEILRNWVQEGGSLFLIADHMPMGGAAAELAAAFGFGFTNGFATDTSRQGPAFFYRNDFTLGAGKITDGRNENERVDKVVTFTGQAFTFPEEATSVINFNDRWVSRESDTAWVFDETTRITPIMGYSQGAYMEYGKGRMVVFGEAAMFTAQLGGPERFKAGMNAEYAEQNYILLLNIIHWLDRKY